MSTNNASDASLRVFVWHSEDGPFASLYGTPEGLRQLAGRLTALADLDQSSLPDSRCPPDEGVHEHVLKPTTAAGLAGLVIGRLDRKKDGSTEWCRG